MVEKIKRPDFWNKLVSVLIAIGLWFFVAYSENPQIELWFSGIQITYLNESTLSDKGLVRVKGENSPTVSVKVRGNRSAILSLTATDIVATVDLSTVKKAADNSLPISIKFPIDGLTTVDKKPYNITVKTENIVTKEFNVSIVQEGEAQEGMSVNCTSSVEKVSVTGGESIIENIKDCVAKVDISEAENKKTIQSAIELRLKNNEFMLSEDVKMSNTFTQITVGIKKTKEAAIKVIFDGVDESKIKKVKLLKDTVRIYGDEDVVEGIETVESMPVKLKISEGTEKVSLTFNLPEGVKVDTGEIITAEITLKEE